MRKKRVGWRARYEQLLRDAIGPPQGLDAHTQVAIRCFLRQGLLRGADTVPDGVSFDASRHSTLGDLEFHDTPRQYAQCTVQPAKKSEQQGKTEQVFLPKGNGITDAYSALRKMLRERKRTFGDEPSDAPLFRFENGQHYQVRHVRTLFKESGKIIGVDAAELGAQSARIGGATDLMVTDCSPAVLQISGRWVRKGI